MNREEDYAVYENRSAQLPLCYTLVAQAAQPRRLSAPWDYALGYRKGNLDGFFSHSAG
jgi:hypothetical protein